MVPEEPLEVMKPLSDQEVLEGETVNLECELSKPDQKVTWHKENKKVSHGGRFTISMEDTKHTLVISNAELTDQSAYTIKSDDVSSTANVFVTGMGIMHYQYISCVIVYLKISSWCFSISILALRTTAVQFKFPLT